jgi:hypothetical protein|tara:strand:- start:175 stop:867 length:693 start_codon:yes stop_codon:yes gene_type:complete
VYTWNNSEAGESILAKHSTFIIFASAATSALIMAMLLHTYFNDFMVENPLINYILFGPAFGIGFLYGLKISEKALQPSETRSALKRKIIKTFLFFLVIGGLFSSVNFALHGGAMMPETSPIDDGLLIWIQDMLTSNGGTTFLIASSFTLMAAATRRIVGLNAGMLSRVITFAGTFIFFSMISMSITQSDPTHSQVYLYTFYHAGIIGGAMYQMNRFTTNLNKWEDYMNDQ